MGFWWGGGGGGGVGGGVLGGFEGGGGGGGGWGGGGGGGVVGRDERKLEQTRDELEQGPETALAVACDVTDRDAVAALVQRVLGSFGSIDVLVCNAGINVRNRSLEALSSDDWDKMIAVNLTGPFNPTSAPECRSQCFPESGWFFSHYFLGVNNQLKS